MNTAVSIGEAIASHRIYRQLMKLIPDLATLKAGDHRKGSSRYDLMDLSMDILEKTDGKARIALSHHYEVNGDLVPDPTMEMIVDFNLQMVQAKMFQDSIGYTSTYASDNQEKEVSMNKFLYYWLTQCLENGYNLKRSPRNSNTEIEE